MKPVLTIMVGLPGSGKSSDAKETKYLMELMLNNTTTLLASDTLREELYGNRQDTEHNAEIFAELYRRMRHSLTHGENVILDATNITMKSRRKIFGEISGIDCTVHARILATPYENCLKQNEERDYPVPKAVIRNMMSKFQIPIYNEGFDSIRIIKKYSDLEARLTCRAIESLCKDFDQNNPHHKYTLEEHNKKTFVEFIKRCDLKEVSISTLAGVLHHDVGKLITESRDETGVSHYYGHANSGAYLIMCNNYFNISLEGLWMINYHMLPFNWGNEKTRRKWEERLGTELFKNLTMLHEADMTSA